MENKLKEFRTEKGIAIWNLASKTKVGACTICAIEKYGYEPRHPTKQKIASAMDLSVEAIWPTDQSTDPVA